MLLNFARLMEIYITKILIIGILDILVDTLNVTYCQKIYMNAVI